MDSRCVSKGFTQMGYGGGKKGQHFISYLSKQENGGGGEKKGKPRRLINFRRGDTEHIRVEMEDVPGLVEKLIYYYVSTGEKESNLPEMGCLIESSRLAYTGHLKREIARGEAATKELEKKIKGIWLGGPPREADKKLHIEMKNKTKSKQGRTDNEGEVSTWDWYM